MPESDTSRRQRSRERYGRVLEVVEHNTSGPDGHQSAGMRSANLVCTLAGPHGEYDADAVRSTIRAAVENEDLVRWGTPRGRVYYARRTEEGLLDVIREQAASERPDESLLGDANRALQEVRDDD